jgi:GNAT superfamily N-acetyltransferase
VFPPGVFQVVSQFTATEPAAADAYCSDVADPDYQKLTIRRCIRRKTDRRQCALWLRFQRLDVPARISRWTAGTLPSGLSRLAAAARNEGHPFLIRLQDEWRNGANRFAGPDECLFIAETASAEDADGKIRSTETAGTVAGIAGISRDPYQAAPNVGRPRHVYVDKPYRSQGIANTLVRACLTCSGFQIIRLSTTNPVAARLYERLGFQPATTDGERMTHLLSPDTA